MKTFTCNEMGGPNGCTESFSGETAKEVGDQGGAHIMSSTDETHASMKQQMMDSDEAAKDAWWAGFNKQFDEKAE